jgi:hypothetical protein
LVSVSVGGRNQQFEWMPYEFARLIAEKVVQRDVGEQDDAGRINQHHPVGHQIQGGDKHAIGRFAHLR